MDACVCMCEKNRDAKDRDAKDRDAKDRDAKDRDAKDRDVKDRDAKDRERRTEMRRTDRGEREERERERGWPARSAAPAGGTLTKTAVVPLEGAGSSFLFIFGKYGCAGVI